MSETQLQCDAVIVGVSLDPCPSAAAFRQFHRWRRIWSVVRLAMACLALAVAAVTGFIVAEHQHDAGGVIIDCTIGYHQVGDRCAKLP